MLASTEIKNISISLLKAQKEIALVKKDAKNPFYKSSYASLEAIIDAVKKPLNDNGIVFIQPLVSGEAGVYVETTLIHESGEWLSSRMKIEQAKQNDPQSQGSAISYARRYSLQSMLGLGAEDDDAETAMARPVQNYNNHSKTAYGKQS